MTERSGEPIFEKDVAFGLIFPSGNVLRQEVYWEVVSTCTSSFDSTHQLDQLGLPRYPQCVVPLAAAAAIVQRKRKAPKRAAGPEDVETVETVPTRQICGRVSKIGDTPMAGWFILEHP